MKFFASLAAVLASTSAVSAAWVPSTSFSRVQSSGLEHSLESRDVCKQLASCVGHAGDSLAVVQAMKKWANGSKNACLNGANNFFNQLVANDYAVSKRAIAGKTQNLTVPFTYNKKNYFINAKAAVIKGSSKTNACPFATPAKYAQLAASGFYEFCSDVKTIAPSSVATRFEAADTASDAAQKPKGPDSIVRFFVSTKKGTANKPCTVFGIPF